MSTGHARRRRLWTHADARLRAELMLRGPQVEVWHAFHETALLAGSRRFSARVLVPGAGLQWWDAQILTYTFEPIRSAHRWARVTCDLHLRGDPQDEGPVLGEFSFGMLARLTGSAELVLPIRFAFAPVAALSGTVEDSIAFDFAGGLAGRVSAGPFAFDCTAALDGEVAVGPAIF